MDSHNVWESVLARVETKVNRHSFYTWFRPSSLLSETGDLVRVRLAPQADCGAPVAASMPPRSFSHCV